MGDWSDLMEAFDGRLPRDIARAQMVPGYSGGKRKEQRSSVTFTMTREQKKKYSALGGSVWVKKLIDSAVVPLPKEKPPEDVAKRI